MKLATVIDPKFKEIIKKLMEQPLPIKASYKLAGIVKKVDEENARFEEVRQASLKNFGTKNEAGNLQIDENNNVKFTQENLIEFSKQLAELGQEDVEFQSIKISDLGDKVELTPSEMLIIADLFVD